MRAKGGYQQRWRDKALDTYSRPIQGIFGERKRRRKKPVHQLHVPESVSRSTSSLLCPDAIEALISSSVVVTVVLLLLFHLRGECHFLFSDDGRTTRWFRFRLHVLSPRAKRAITARTGGIR